MLVLMAGIMLFSGRRHWEKRSTERVEFVKKHVDAETAEDIGQRLGVTYVLILLFALMILAAAALFPFAILASRDILPVPIFTRLVIFTLVLVMLILWIGVNYGPLAKANKHLIDERLAKEKSMAEPRVLARILASVKRGARRLNRQAGQRPT
ncbi:MAG: hypothetical protein FWD18_09530 [Micrococcales bacterium]|nr:hypothetical protein [Micrococcales bacterium]